MKKIIVFIVMLTVVSLGELCSQNTKTRSVTLNAGVGNIMRQDLSFSPFVHKDWTPINANLTYAVSGKLNHRFHISFGLYDPINGESFNYTSFYAEGEQSIYPHSFAVVDLNYSLSKTLVEKEKVNLALGGRFRNRLNPSAYNFSGYGLFGYYFTQGVDVWLNVQYDLADKHHLEGNIYVPIGSWNSRSPYMSMDDEHFENFSSHKGMKVFASYIQDGELQSWGKAQAVDLDLAYFYRLSEKFKIGMAYKLSMNFNQDPQQYSSVENVFFISGKFKF